MSTGRAGLSVHKAGARLAELRTPSKDLARGYPPASLAWGVIVSVQAGPPKTVTITIGGSSVQASGIGYMAAYTPTPGDKVAILVAGSDYLVLGAQA